MIILSKLFHNTLGSIFTEFKNKYYSKDIEYLESGDFYVSKNPPFVSQFANAKKDLIINPYKEIKDLDAARRFGAEDLKEFSYWAGRSCAIACLEMIVRDINENKSYKGSTMDLVNKAFAYGGYDTKKDVGWYHHAIIKLAREFGFSGSSKKFVSPNEIVKLLRDNHYIIASIKYKTETNTDSHLFWIYGYKINNKKVEGFWINDPSYPLGGGKNIFISLNEFIKLSTRRIIDLKYVK